MQDFSKFFEKRWIFALALCLGIQGFGGFFGCQGSLSRVVADPKHASSAELELFGYPDTILALLTTPDGKVGGLFRGYDLAPARAIYPGKTDEQILATPWDSVSPANRRKLIAAVAEEKAKRSTFFEDRRFPNLKIRDAHPIPLAKLGASPELTPFLGGAAPLPDGNFPIGSYLRNPEFADPSQNPLNTELHLRVKLPAGDVMKAAWALEKMLGVPQTGLHIHVVADFPAEKIRADREGTAAAITDFYRRANAILEFTHIVDRKGGIGRNQKDNAVYWDNLPAENLTGVYDYFVYTRELRTPNIGSNYKMAHVGFRGADTYDAPGIFGFEVRDIYAGANVGRTADFLNTLQWGLSEAAYGLEGTELKEWARETYPEVSLREALRRSWYDRDLSELVAAAQPKIRELMEKEPNRTKVQSEKLNVPSTSKEAHSDDIKILIHPWHRDPIYFKFPRVQEKIQEIQLEALSKYLNGEMGRNEAVSLFLNESKLRAAMDKSLSSSRQEVVSELYPDLIEPLPPVAAVAEAKVEAKPEGVQSASLAAAEVRVDAQPDAAPPTTGTPAPEKKTEKRPQRNAWYYMSFWPSHP